MFTAEVKGPTHCARKHFNRDLSKNLVETHKQEGRFVFHKKPVSFLRGILHIFTLIASKCFMHWKMFVHRSRSRRRPGRDAAAGRKLCKSGVGVSRGTAGIKSLCTYKTGRRNSPRLICSVDERR